MKIFRQLFFFFFLFSFQHLSANEKQVILFCFSPGDTIAKDSVELKMDSDTLPKKIFKSDIEKRRFVAAVLAFPVPFGILGLHRIYLGTAPYVPVAYVLTLGGGFGLLPLMDFFEIVFSSDEKMKSFEQNPKIFMWD